MTRDAYLKLWEQTKQVTSDEIMNVINEDHVLGKRIRPINQPDKVGTATAYNDGIYTITLDGGGEVEVGSDELELVEGDMEEGCSKEAVEEEEVDREGFSADDDMQDVIDNIISALEDKLEDSGNLVSGDLEEVLDQYMKDIRYTLSDQIVAQLDAKGIDILDDRENPDDDDWEDTDEGCAKEYKTK